MTLLTLREAADRLRVSRATALRLINDGHLPSIVLAERQRRRLLRVSEEALNAFLSGRMKDVLRGSTADPTSAEPKPRLMGSER